MTIWLTNDAAGAITQRGYGPWVAGLDVAVNDLCARFALTPTELLSGGTMGAVIRCKTAGSVDVVLKTSPSIEAIENERQFLIRLPAGVGPAVFASEPGALVLELLMGGHESGQLGDEVAVEALARLPLWSHDDPGEVGDVVKLVEKITQRLAARDAGLATAFAESTSVVQELWGDEPVWCHGDLQAENMFWDSRRLRVIDPLATWAPMGLDVGYWAVDPLRNGDLVARLGLLERALGMSGRDLVAWATLGAAQHTSWLWHYGVRPELAARAEITLREVLGLRAES